MQAAAKAAKKKQGLVLGLGVTGLRDHILSLTNGDISSATLVSATVSLINEWFSVLVFNLLVWGSMQSKVVDPYSGACLGEFAVALYEKLGSGGQKRKPKIAKVREDCGKTKVVV